MSKLIDQILDQIPKDFFTDAELRFLFGAATPAARYNQIKRALAKGQVVQIRRGIYALAKRYQRKGIDPYELAQNIYGPSYVSFESALSYHGLIPEAVYAITCATTKRARDFKTPLGLFSYRQVPLRSFSEGVLRIVQNDHAFLMATPLKAITDYVFVHRLQWKGLEPLEKSLRIEAQDLKIQSEEIENLQLAFGSAKTTLFIVRFLESLRKDLNL